MTNVVSTPMKSLVHRLRKPIPLNPDDPNAAILLRGRKGDARESELIVAEQIAAGTKRRKPTGIYGKRA